MRIVQLVLIGCLASSTAACGSETEKPWQPEWRASKPGAQIGAVRAAVVERPGAGRALIEARWDGIKQGAICALELVVPEDVTVLEGDRVTPLPYDGGSGSVFWRVDFPPGRTLDAVIRLGSEAEDGPRATETSVRLFDAP